MLSTICTKLWIFKENLKEDARGVSALEYAILIAVIIGIVVFFFTSEDIGLKKMFGDLFENVSENVEKVTDDSDV